MGKEYVIDVEPIKQVLLVSPSAEVPDGRIDPPLGLCYLSAMLDKNKYSVTGRNYLGIPWKEMEPKIREELYSNNYDVIGIQCLTYNRSACFKLAKLNRRRKDRC